MSPLLTILALAVPVVAIIFAFVARPRKHDYSDDPGRFINGYQAIETLRRKERGRG